MYKVHSWTISGGSDNIKFIIDKGSRLGAFVILP